MCNKTHVQTNYTSESEETKFRLSRKQNILNKLHKTLDYLNLNFPSLWWKSFFLFPHHNVLHGWLITHKLLSKNEKISAYKYENLYFFSPFTYLELEDVKLYIGKTNHNLNNYKERKSFFKSIIDMTCTRLGDF